MDYVVITKIRITYDNTEFQRRSWRTQINSQFNLGQNFWCETTTLMTTNDSHMTIVGSVYVVYRLILEPSFMRYAHASVKDDNYRLLNEYSVLGLIQNQIPWSHFFYVIIKFIK